MPMERFQPIISQEPHLVRLLKEWQKNPSSLSFVPLADGYRKLGLHKQALEICEEGLLQHPDLASAMIVKARIFFEQKRYAGCLEIARAILRRNGGNIKAHRIAADVYLRLGQKHRALQELGELILLYPSDMQTLREIEALERELMDAQNSSAPQQITHTRQAANDFSAYQVQDLRGFRVLPERSPELTRSADIEIPVSLNANLEASDSSGEPTFATRTIAELYLRQGHESKARKVLEKMLAIDPEDGWASDTLRRITLGMGEQIISSEKSVNKVALAKVKFLQRLLAHVEGA